MDAANPSGRDPVHEEELPSDLSPWERRPARMRLIAGRRLAGVTAVLDGVHDPHNISAVLRSCDAFGVQHVHLIGNPADLAPNRTITRGCQKWLALHYHANAKACANALHEQGFELWAALPDREATPLDGIDFSRKVAFLFGAERDGLSDEMIAHADGRFFIPMSGFSQSLNVSVAAAISLYVGTSERRRSIGGPSDMPPDNVNALAQAWIEADETAKRRGRAAPG